MTVAVHGSYNLALIVIILFAISLTGCAKIQNEATLNTTPAISEASITVPASGFNPVLTVTQTSPAFRLAEYSFPISIDRNSRYMFYLHGKIIEDQGLPAISPEFGEYKYEAILERLCEHGFVVISEQRTKNTDGEEYARKIAGQLTRLLDAGVPAKHITVAGASKGAGIAIYVSHFLANQEINYVLLAICHPEEVEYLKQNRITLYGNILSIYDSVDEFAGSCQALFSFSEGKGISRHEELVLSIGMGHGILYQPLNEWIKPTVQWAGK